LNAPQTEQLVTMPLINPDTGCPSRTFTYAGKVDMVTADGILVDWKTTGDPLGFVQQTTLGCQVECYALAYEHMTGERLRGVEYRLVQRPSIRFCGKDASPEAYEQRCYDWLLEKPHAVIEHTAWITPSRLSYARAWLWNSAKRILDCRNHDRWLMNETACHTWQRACPYLPLCMAEATGARVADVLQADYQPRDMQHEELGPDVLDSVLTYSSAKTLGMCERRYYWRHEARWQPRVNEDGEALSIGSAFHALMDGQEPEAPLVLGADAAHRQDEMLAKARAMARAARLRWAM